MNRYLIVRLDPLAADAVETLVGEALDRLRTEVATASADTKYSRLLCKQRQLRQALDALVEARTRVRA